MSPHRQTYLDLNPEPEDNPPMWLLILGAVVGFAALWMSLVFFLSL